ncbi:MAG TPA: methyltransferase domain-containing protein [Myxococcota bacterium]|nr:methyltransferase domain-containing protein [Myxococcota bacterium]
MTDKPAHLAPEFGAQFAERSVVAAYRTRPPYPPGTCEILLELVTPAGAPVLELGAGSGDLTCELAPRVAALDAVEPAEAMLAVARERAARIPNLRWFASGAESFETDLRYGLAVAAESLHWMEWKVVLPKLARLLRPAAPLAIVTRGLEALPWDAELGRLIATHSTNRDFRAYDLVEELAQRGLFRERGRRRTPPATFAQPLADYVESFHSRNGFSRERMTAAGADAFDAALRALVLRHAPDGELRLRVSALVIFGTPLSG